MKTWNSEFDGRRALSLSNSSVENRLISDHSLTTCLYNNEYNINELAVSLPKRTIVKYDTSVLTDDVLTVTHFCLP